MAGSRSLGRLLSAVHELLLRSSSLDMAVDNSGSGVPQACESVGTGPKFQQYYQ